MIHAPLGDPELESRLSSLPEDGITRFSMLGSSVKGALIAGNRVAASARAQHGLGLMESLALSQALLCAGLLSTTLKDGGRLGLRMECSGVLEGFSVEASWNGDVRGYLFCGPIRLDKALESFDLQPFIGSGTLSVRRNQAEGESYTGHIALVHGRIAEDVAEYFLRSEQTRTALGVGVRFDPRGRVAGAGGLFFQALPGAKDLDMEDLELRMKELPSLGTWFSQGRTREEFLREWFGAFDVRAFSETPALFDCPCSRERYATFLGALQKSELKSMAEEGPWPTELVCHNCGSRYAFGKEELVSFLEA
jgi:molecular chaperone Hsp33